MAKIRWGLLGTARINRAIISAVRDSTRSEISAVASRRPETAAAYAAEWNIPAAVSPYAALLDRDDVDAVYIGLPNTMHVEWTVRALHAGKHVLCEKPLALTAEGVDEIAAAAARSGRVAAEAFMYRHHPLTRVVLETLSAGKIGALRLVTGAFTYQLTGRTHDIRTDAALGGGSLWDVGCYPVSYACLVHGTAPAEVFGWQETNDAGVDLSFAGMLRFGDGVIAQFDSGFRTIFRAEMQIVGSNGVLRVEKPFKTMPESRLLLIRGDDVSEIPVKPEAAYIGEIEDFASAVIEGRPHPVPLAESRRTATVLTALYASARAHAPVPL